MGELTREKAGGVKEERPNLQGPAGVVPVLTCSGGWASATSVSLGGILIRTSLEEGKHSAMMIERP